MRSTVVKRKRRCMFCVRQTMYIDYKDLKWLTKYLSSFNRILPKRYTGNCIQHQDLVSGAIKKARQMALLPYTDHHKRVYK